MRKIIIERIENIKSEESNFKSVWWIDNYFSYLQNNVIVTNHISRIDFDLINDYDLIRLFEYIILSRSDITTQRVKKVYGN